jgi:hypothetical protein
MSAAVVPAFIGPLMPFCVAQLRGFLVQPRVEGFFDGLSNDSFQVVLEIFYPLKGICERKYTLPERFRII